MIAEDAPIGCNDPALVAESGHATSPEFAEHVSTCLACAVQAQAFVRFEAEALPKVALDYVCSDCGHEQDSMDRHCDACNSVRVVAIAVLEQALGPKWREAFE